jgi:hypothetical protein
MSSDKSATGKTLQQLRDVRQSLLGLHKVLLEFEREAYERAHDRIETSYQFLNLVMNDPWFAWLRNISELIVRMDEMLDTKESPTEGDALAVIDQTRDLVAPSETGAAFQRKYFEALQKSPDVVLAHSKTVKLLGPGRLQN